jgi:hypothetical protein
MWMRQLRSISAYVPVSLCSHRTLRQLVLVFHKKCAKSVFGERGVSCIVHISYNRSPCEAYQYLDLPPGFKMEESHPEH